MPLDHPGPHSRSRRPPSASDRSPAERHLAIVHRLALFRSKRHVPRAVTTADKARLLLGDAMRASADAYAAFRRAESLYDACNAPQTRTAEAELAACLRALEAASKLAAWVARQTRAKMEEVMVARDVLNVAEKNVAGDMYGLETCIE